MVLDPDPEAVGYGTVSRPGLHQAVHGCVRLYMAVHGCAWLCWVGLDSGCDLALAIFHWGSTNNAVLELPLFCVELLWRIYGNFTWNIIHAWQCISPYVFSVILKLIKDHNIFCNHSNVPQSPIDFQLAVTLFRMGCFGNAASVIDVAQEAGCSPGSVEAFTEHCFTAIESLYNIFVWPLTADKKEAVWIDAHMGFKGLWRDGWVMYDGTIIVLYAHPGLDGDAYYTQKSNYGLNLQVSPIFFMKSLIIDK